MAATKFPSVSDVNLKVLYKAIDVPEDAIIWCREHGLLKQHRPCDVCGRDMPQHIQADKSDGCRFFCCKKEVSIRDESFFSGSKLNIWQIVIILYMYSHQTATVKNLRHECNISSPNAITNWRNYVRDIYAEYFLRHPSQIGGPGHTVEIDESAFVRRKYNRGHQVNTQWVFGGIDVNTKDVFLVAVERRDAETLLPVLQEHVLHGTTVISDLWRAYSTVGHIGYKHMTVNHNVHFVDPQTGATTNHVEAMWGATRKSVVPAGHFYVLI